ncbi:MAG: sugar ABC transporter ATP-binding protein, partial [Lachnospiraceae bacterium]|nr:sugar ABC transporter ATP-binding protein [Lachnospiraceae bacterium]
IEGLKRKGISLIFVSHKLDEVMQLSQEIVIMRNGEKVADGGISDFTKEDIIYHMTGRRLSSTSYEGPQSAGAKTTLEVKHITQRGGFTDVSFGIKECEIVGITGLLGSGRTALANALFGIHKIDSGEILLEGKKVKLGSVRSAVSNGIAYVPEDRLTEGLFLSQPIGKNIAVTVLDKISNRIGILKASSIKALALQWIETLHIKTSSDELLAHSLSGGNQQKVVIAKWLAIEPKVLILNGPTVGVDIGAKTDIIEMVKSLARQGMSIILVSDDVSEIMMCCNRILLMRGGRITEEILTDHITEPELYAKIRAQEV